MYGYVMWGDRPAFSRQKIAGMWFAVAAVPRKGWSFRRRRVLRRLRRSGVVRCVLPPELEEEAARFGLLPVEVQRLRCAVLPQLLSKVEGLDRSTAVLRAEYASPEVWRCAALLAQRARYVALEVDGGGEALAQALRRRFGLCVGRVGEAAVTVSFSDAPQRGRVIFLGADCRRYQRVAYAVMGDKLGEWPPQEQLLAALLEGGEIKKEEIRVKTISSNA